MTTPLLLTHAAATLLMAGLIWFVQIVHYPLFSLLENNHAPRYSQDHARRTTWVVMPIMLIEATTATLLLLYRPPEIPLNFALAGVVLLAIIWASTFFLQVPCHQRLATRFDATTVQRLVLTNWLRTLAWTLRAILALVMIAQRML